MPADTRLGLDIDARDIGSPLDSEVMLYDGQGQVITSNDDGTAPDDTMGTTSDSYISHLFAPAGTYMVRVSAAGTAGPTSMFYELTIKPEAGCLDLDRDGSTSCTTDCNDFNASVNPGAVDVCDSVDNNCNGQTDERCTGGCFDDLLEQNDSASAAAPVSPGFLAQLRMCGGDADFYAIAGTAGQTLIFGVSMGLEPIQMVATLYDTDLFTPLVTTTPDAPSISHVLPSTGTYVVGLTSPAGSEANYEVVVTLTP